MHSMNISKKKKCREKKIFFSTLEGFSRSFFLYSIPWHISFTLTLEPLGFRRSKKRRSCEMKQRTHQMAWMPYHLYATFTLIFFGCCYFRSLFYGSPFPILFDYQKHSKIVFFSLLCFVFFIPFFFFDERKSFFCYSYAFLCSHVF